jgi:hypothetical protein
MDSVRYNIISLITLLVITNSCFSAPEEYVNIYDLRPPELLSDTSSLTIVQSPLQSLYISDDRVLFEVNNLTDVAFTLSIWPGNTNWSRVYWLKPSEEDSYFDAYVKSRLSEALSYCNNKSSKKEKQFLRPHLWDCGIRETVRITSDVTLYGRAPGSNLIDYCRLERPGNYGSRLICSYPDNSVLSELSLDNYDRSMALEDFFQVGSTLIDLSRLSFVFTSVPEENPESFNINVEIPIECNYWFNNPETRSFIKAADYTQALPPTERVLSASIHIDIPYQRLPHYRTD